MEKFSNVPVDEGTVIKKTAVVKVGNFDALLQKWVWEGVIAESLIFVEDDLIGVSNEELLGMARQYDFIRGDSKPTVVRDSAGYAFVNMNFENPL